MAQQFEQPQVEQSLGEQTQDAAATLRTQRMTADESRAVIDLWQQERVEQTGLTDKPAVPDVAEGLDITVEDVRRLLQDVRAKRIAEERALATEQELSEIRLAEEERKLAEIRRQRAELRREQISGDLEQSSRSVYAARRRNTSPLGVVLALIFLFFWFWILFWMIGGAHNGAPFNSGPSDGDCTVTSADGKPQPCPEGMKDMILHGNK